MMRTARFRSTSRICLTSKAAVVGLHDHIQKNHRDVVTYSLSTFLASAAL
jgi:hypothetical protein